MATSAAEPIPPSLAAAGALLGRLPPVVALDDAALISARYFGVTLAGPPVTLSAERDCNIRLTTEAGPLLLKISNPAEDDAAIEAQTLALLHIAGRDPSLPAPRVIPTLADEPILLWDGPAGVLRVRLLTYLPGEPLHMAPASAARRQSVGRLLARLALALRDFDHPGARRSLLWDITHAGDLVVLLPYIADPDRRALAAGFLEAFRRHAAPRLPGLRAQTLHNDFNPHNLLVAPGAPGELAGVIDFGDMVHAAQINDLAIATAYDVPAAGHPLAHAADLISAYHAVNPVLPEEIEVLFDLIAVRQVVSVAIGAWRAQRHPENRDYILRNSQAAWRGLERFAALDRAEAQAYLRGACGMAA